MQDNRDILLDKFFSGELTAEEQLQFEKLLTEDAAFRNEVEAHRDVIGGIEKYGDQFMRAELASVYNEVKNDLPEYKPAKAKTNWWKIVKWLLVASIAGVALFVYLVKQKKITVSKEVETTILKQENRLKEFKETLPSIIQSDTVITIETVYHTIKTSKVNIGDTVTVYGESELKSFTIEHEVMPTK